MLLQWLIIFDDDEMIECVYLPTESYNWDILISTNLVTFTYKRMLTSWRRVCLLYLPIGFDYFACCPLYPLPQNTYINQQRIIKSMFRHMVFAKSHSNALQNAAHGIHIFFRSADPLLEVIIIFKLWKQE